MAEVTIDPAAAPVEATVDVGRRRQALRLRRAGLAVAGCTAFAALAAVGRESGLVELGPITFGVLAGTWVAGALGFLVLIASGRNERFADPALSLPQILWAAAGPVVLYPFMPAMPGVSQVGLLVIALFGAFRLRGWSYVLTNAGLVAALAGAFALRRLLWGDALDADAELAGFVAFAVAFALLTALGFELHGYRRQVRERAAALTRAFERLREAVHLDDLTGVNNRRSLMEMLDRQKAEADRLPDHRFTLCFLDLDHFKRVNDVFGHATGDAVLRRFAEIAGNSVRDVDLVARLGGEEFVLVLVGTPEENAIVVADRIRRQLASFSVSESIPDFRITVSCGVSEYIVGEDVSTTMSRADTALYRAKRNGRDRVEIATEEDAPQRAPVAGAIGATGATEGAGSGAAGVAATDAVPDAAAGTTLDAAGESALDAAGRPALDEGSRT